MSKGMTLSHSFSSLTENDSQSFSTTLTLHRLFELMGWHDISNEVNEKQLEESAIQQSLIAAAQAFDEQPTKENNLRVATIIAKEITRMEAERDYALGMVKQLQKQMSEEQRAAEKAAAEFKPANNYWESLQQISSHFSESITTRVKTFFGSTPTQQVEKYRELAQNREEKLNALKAYREKIQAQEVMTALNYDDPLEPMPLAHSRHLLQTNISPEMNTSYCAPSGTCSLASLHDGLVGFVLLDPQPGDESGLSVSGAGDINGDQLDDILVSMPGTGKIAVVFGSNQPGAWGTGALNLTDLANGQRGFLLLGQAAEGSGASVSGAGDVNGDGLDDILIGAPFAFNQSGQTTVVFGSNKMGAWGSGMLNLTSLADGQRGFMLLGQSGDASGLSVSGAGDINGDGFDDILIGSPKAGGGSIGPAGKVTVVLGSNQTGAWGSGMLNLTSLADGHRGFILLGQPGDERGVSVSSAGDVNGDQLDDILVGSVASKTTVVFGSSKTNAWVSGTLNLTSLVDGQHGFELLGQPGDGSGLPVSSAGDINGDQLDDILIGAFPLSKTTVVFGSNKTGAWGSGTLNLAVLANGQNGFVMIGSIVSGTLDWSGFSVSSAGDMNGDDLDDLLIGAPQLSELGVGGKATVVFGSNQGGAWGSGTLNLADLADGQHGFLMQGLPPTQGQIGAWNGYSVSSAGDMNGDGLDDIIIGAPLAASQSGQTTVVFGDTCRVIVNQLRIAVGETVVLNSSLFAAFCPSQNNATLLLTPEAVQNGRFEAITAPSIALSSFLVENITSVQFQQDGSALAPSYQISVRHTALLYAYSIAQVDFLGYPPVLLNNKVYVNQGLPTLVTSSDLSASDADT